MSEANAGFDYHAKLIVDEQDFKHFTVSDDDKERLLNNAWVEKNSILRKNAIAAKALSPFVILLLILVGLFTLYCLAGVLYNSQVRGTSGIESIPNIDFWRNFLKYVEDGLLYCYLTLTCQERTILHERLMQDDQLSNPNFDDNADSKDGTANENIVTHL